MTTESQLDAVNNGAIGNLNQFEEAMQHDLAPQGILEGIFAAEITRAASRLRRCATIEDELMQQDEPGTATTQSAVDRSRLEAHRILKRSMDELRRLQNERRFRIEVLPEGFNLDDLGLTSYKELMPAMVAEKRWQILKSQQEEIGAFGTDASFEKMLAEQVGPPKPSKGAGPVLQSKKTPQTKQTQMSAEPSPSNSTKRTQSTPTTPGNGPCPCHSGQKYKRCCGRNAAPVLYTAAA